MLEDALPPPAPPTEAAANLAASPAPGDRIDRFIVVGSLGAGAMGMVVAAYDPELDRRIAIKLVHPERATDGRARERLLREARSGAQLSHPNVVQVYEVGTVGDDVFIAFEYVDGETLRAWLAAAPRAVHEVLDVFRQAGRGLAAAHEAGVVHRDFKPDNVLIGRDGRVRVADFGLAGVEPVASDEAFDAARMTRTGALVGTPAYMAPEQWKASWDSATADGPVDPRAATAESSGSGADRARPDPRSDQFSFCVALFEALYGHRPFAGATVFALQHAVLHDRPRTPTQPAVPSRVKAAVLRGLEKEPGARFDDLAALLAELEPPSTSRAMRWGLAAFAALAVVSGAAFAHLSRSPCLEAGAPFDGLWNDAVRARLETHLRATGGAHASEVAARTVSTLARYAAAWKDARTATCRATREERVQSEPLLDVRMRCLDDRARDFAALVQASQAESNTVNVPVAAARLASPGPCRLVRFEGDPTALTPEQQRHVEPARDKVSGARAQVALGSYERARELAAAARREATEQGLTLLRVDAVLEESIALRRLAKLDELETLLGDTRSVAARLGDPARMAQLLDRLVDLQLQRLALDRADVLLEEYRIQNIAAGEPPFLVQGYHYMAGRLFEQRGVYPRAYEEYQKALALARTIYAKDPGRIAVATEGTGIAAMKLARLDEARALLEEAVARGIEAYGEHHAVPSLTRLNLGAVYKQQGQFARAEAAYLASLRVFEAAHPGDNPDTAALLNNLGSLALDRGRLDEAMGYLERALAMRTALFGADSATLVFTYANMGLVRFGQGRIDEAEPRFETSLAIVRAKLGDDHPKRATPEAGLGRIALVRRRFADAIAHYEQAARVTEKAGGATGAIMVDVGANMAYALAELGRCAEAAPLATKTLAIAPSNYDPELPARAHFVLARCLTTGRGTLTDAVEHARAARAGLSAGAAQRAHSPTWATLEGELDAWLARHGDAT